MKYQEQLINEIKSLSSLFNKKLYNIKVIQEIKKDESLFLEVLLEDTYYLYINSINNSYASNDFKRNVDYNSWEEDNLESIKTKLCHIFAKEEFTNKTEKGIFDKLKESAFFIANKLYIQNCDIEKRFVMNSDNKCWGQYLDLEGDGYIIHIGYRYKEADDKFHFMVKGKNFTSNNQSWKGASNFNSFMNKINVLTEDYYYSGLVEKRELYKDLDFEETVVLLEDKNNIKYFNKKILEITKHPLVKIGKNESIDIKLLVNSIERNQKLLSEKEKMIAELEVIFTKIDKKDKDLILLCENNLTKAKQLYETEKLQIQKQLEYYMKLSQKFFNDELSKLQSEVLKIA